MRWGDMDALGHVNNTELTLTDRYSKNAGAEDKRDREALSFSPQIPTP